MHSLIIFNVLLNASNLSESFTRTTLSPNTSNNFDRDVFDEDVGVSAASVALCSFLAIISVMCIGGNSLVIFAVMTSSHLRSVTNFLVSSLAVADLIVGLFVVPFNIVHEMSPPRQWTLGLIVCDIWHSLDVLASSASIWSLCVISVDRFLAVRDPFTYPGLMSMQRAAALVAVVWIGSVSISFPAIVWWRRDSPHLYINEMECQFTDSLAYLSFSSLVSFYIPLLVMAVAYWRVYIAAANYEKGLRTGRRQACSSSSGANDSMLMRIHRGRNANNDDDDDSPKSLLANCSTSSTRASPNLSMEPAEILHIHICTHNIVQSNKPQKGNIHECTGELEDKTLSFRCAMCSSKTLVPSRSISRARWLHTHHALRQGSLQQSPRNYGGVETHAVNLAMIYEPLRWKTDENRKNQKKIRRKVKRKISRFAREKKAAKTLGIVVGCFIACWLPFFVVNVLLGFCVNCVASPTLVYSIVTTLGYFNSALNPIIYAWHSNDFRTAFNRILCRVKRKSSTIRKPTLRRKTSSIWCTNGVVNAVMPVIPRLSHSDTPDDDDDDDDDSTSAISNRGVPSSLSV